MSTYTYCINGQITFKMDTRLQEFLVQMDQQVCGMDTLQDLDTIQH